MTQVTQRERGRDGAPAPVRRRMPAADRRALILEAAREAFAEGGYHRTSLEEIAERAGVSKALLYEHFDSKRELHRAMLETHVNELIARLNAALRRAAPRDDAEPVLSADGLELDLVAHQVSRDGEPIHLTPIEFDLLRTLMRNRGRLMTHRVLLSTVWGPAYAGDTQTLRVHVANLRRKIEPDPGAPRYITTDPGVGYRFTA